MVSVISEDRDHPVIKRAVTAHYRSRRQLPGQHIIVPERVQLAADNGKQYVVLWAGRNVLRVYRVRPSDGVLRQLKRWPVGLTARLRIMV